MKFTILIISFALGLTTAVALEPATTNDKEEILKIERRWCDAYLHGDAEFLKHFLVDDFTLTNSNGEISTKADDLKDIAAGTTKYEVFENRDMRVVIHGDTAVVTGWTKVKGVSDGKAYATDVAFTDTLARFDGEWHGVAGHVSKPSH